MACDFCHQMSVSDLRFGPGTALLVVDVQNDFADPAGSLSVRGGERVVEEASKLVREAESAGSAVVYTQDWHPESTPHFAKDGGIWPVHCVAGTWGAELHPGLVVAGPSVRKGVGGEDGYSGFSMRHPVEGEKSPTGLADLLRERGIERVVIVGLATDYCVKETALDAIELGLETAVVHRAVAAVDVEPGDGVQALDAISRAGVVLV